MFVETKRQGEATFGTRPNLKGFVTWLKTKDPSETYDWGDCSGGCAVGQYLQYCGISWSNRPRGLYFSLAFPGNDRSVVLLAKTFGEVLKNVENFIASQ
jgi:hypothetical protein